MNIPHPTQYVGSSTIHHLWLECTHIKLNAIGGSHYKTIRVILDII